MADDTDKLLGAWAHLPLLFGLLVPIVVWLIKKDKNKELAFQAKQALVWQVLATILLSVVGIGILIVTLIAGANLPTATTAIIVLLSLVVLGVIALAFGIFAILGAWKTFQGEKFRYPVIGKMLGG